MSWLNKGPLYFIFHEIGVGFSTPITMNNQDMDSALAALAFAVIAGLGFLLLFLAVAQPA